MYKRQALPRLSDGGDWHALVKGSSDTKRCPVANRGTRNLQKAIGASEQALPTIQLIFKDETFVAGMGRVVAVVVAPDISSQWSLFGAKRRC